MPSTNTFNNKKNEPYIDFSEADGYNFDDYDSHFQTDF
ncbi:hypothetical protein BAME_33640 [Bacillus sp. M 2-6]|nr:hypothetical protein BAME_33640 [Bacillus sp. M 2-6]